MYYTKVVIYQVNINKALATGKPVFKKKKKNYRNRRNQPIKAEIPTTNQLNGSTINKSVTTRCSSNRVSTENPGTSGDITRQTPQR
jgi:hypothetical protein